MQHEIITTLGGVNVAAFQSEYGVLNIEIIIDADPDVICIVEEMGTMVEGVLSSEYTNNLIFAGLKAVQNQQIYVVGHNLTSRNGPRAVDALEEYARILYPEIFGEPVSPH
jgi:iron complex transport system substrate-binding protein